MKWAPVRAEIAKECEALFQAGGPRVYIQYGDGPKLCPSLNSAVTTVWAADPGVLVYARRKVRGQRLYEWFVCEVHP